MSVIFQKWMLLLKAPIEAGNAAIRSRLPTCALKLPINPVITELNLGGRFTRRLNAHVKAGHLGFRPVRRRECPFQPVEQISKWNSDVHQSFGSVRDMGAAQKRLVTDFAAFGVRAVAVKAAIIWDIVAEGFELLLIRRRISLGLD
jgi:hypothetical protein